MDWLLGALCWFLDVVLWPVDRLAGSRWKLILPYGPSVLSSVGRRAWYVQQLHRYNETVALDYLVPFRVIHHRATDDK
jgi:hypothetical protein